MPRNREFIDSVFFFGASADVVDHQGLTRCVFLITDDHDVGEGLCYHAGDEVSGEEFGFLVAFGEGDGNVISGEKRHEIGDAAVVDVLIGRF